MIKFFRNIRLNVMGQNKTSKYLLYAFGEIILVVIGILIALQINNWNESNKSKKTELYVLNEVLNNLDEDGSILDEIIYQRQKAKVSVARMLDYLHEESINKDTLEMDLVNFLSFERYFPINNAYEILKSKGLQLSNNVLTTKISRYYDYEQKKLNRSIEDVETAILNILNNPKSINRFVDAHILGKSITLINVGDPSLKKELYSDLVAFKNNNIGTLEKLIAFNELHKALKTDIERELKHFNK